MNSTVAFSPSKSERTVNDYVRDAVVEACKDAIRPLVRQCIKHGISFQDLIAALRYVYIDSAAEDFERETEGSAARIALISGLSRGEVEGLQGVDPGSKSVVALMTASSQILSAWHSDPDFTGPYGIPLELPVDSPRGFDGLCERFGNGLPTDEILDDLLRVGCVALTKQGKVKALRRSYIAGIIDPSAYGYAGKCLRSFAETLQYNIEHPDSTEKRFQRQLTSTLGIRESDLPAFNEILKEAGQKFLEDLDAWTTEREKAVKKLEKVPDEIPRVYPGVGMYTFFQQAPVRRTKQNG